MTKEGINLKERFYFLDNIKVVLTIFVVMHHIAITYGASSGWYYYEHSQDKISVAILNFFLAVNRAYFMGFFFFIAGYFSPGSLDRNGAGRFMKERVLRLGVPLVFFSFLIRPSIVYIMSVDTLGQRYIFWENLAAMKNVAPGPTWFLEALLLFTFCYLLWVYLSGRRTSRPEAGRSPGLFAILAFGAFLGFATFGARVIYPTDTEVFHLRPGNFPQYISLFIMGVVASRHSWALAVKSPAGKSSLAVVFLLLPVLAWAMITGGVFDGGAGPFKGGWTWQSFFLSYWENFFCLSMIIGMLFLFHKGLNHQGRILKAMAGSAYGVYIIHPPLIVFLSCSLKSVILNPVLKFGLVTLIGVPLCFLVTHTLVRKIPGVSKIL